MNRKMEISVVIPTYNRPEDLHECLDSIKRQSAPPLEVLVVDNGSGPDAARLVDKRKDEFRALGIALRYIRNEKENALTTARNIGVDNASGGIISFLDDDMVIEKDYFKEILKVYRNMPEALGVTGYLFTPHMDRVDFQGRLHFTSSFHEVNRCRVFPSITVSYPDPRFVKDIVSCEWLSGASTYKGEVFREFRFDENLKKYSNGEDTEFPYRIYKKHPGSLYLTPRAVYKHKVSDIGRNPKREMVFMDEIYSLYIFFRIIDQNIKNKAIYIFSRMGRLVNRTMDALVKRSGRDLREVRFRIDAYFQCLNHLDEIRSGNLEFFNKTLD